MTYNVLLVEDDRHQLDVLQAVVQKRLHCNTKIADCGKKAIDILKTSREKIDLVLLDIFMPDMDGLDVLKQIKPLTPHVPVIVCTGCDDVDIAIAAVKEGAVDFVRKFDSYERLEFCVNRALKNHVFCDALPVSSPGKIPVYFEDFISNSAVFGDIVAFSRKLADMPVPVAICGEDGCGKHMFAQAMHSAGIYQGGPFIRVDASLIPEALIEAVFFGNKASNSSHLKYDIYGKVREAEGGTLFIEGFDQLSLMIQEKIFTATGSCDDSIYSDKPFCKLIYTMKGKCADEDNGRFRVEEMCRNFGVTYIDIPTLRDRGKMDVILLARHFLGYFTYMLAKDITYIESEAEQLLSQYDWPGNVRQLKNTIIRAIILSQTKHLSVDNVACLLNPKSVHLGYDV